MKYAVYYGQGMLMYAWNFNAKRFDRITMKFIETEDHYSTKEEAQKVLDWHNQYSTYKGRVWMKEYQQHNTEARYKEGGIPERYKNMGFSKVGEKKKSTIPEKKWMVLAKKGDKYKVVHGGAKGMQDYSQHHDKERRKRFWDRMGGRNSDKARDPFSPLYWHKKFGTWSKGGVLENGTLKVVWIDTDQPDTFESKMFDTIEEALKYADGKTYLIMQLEDNDDDYYKWTLLPYGEHERYKTVINWSNIFEQGGSISPELINKNKSTGGLLVGKTDKDGHEGIRVIAPEGSIRMGGAEIIINEKSATKHCELLSKINSEDGNGVEIPCDIQPISNTTESKMKPEEVISAAKGLKVRDGRVEGGLNVRGLSDSAIPGKFYHTLFTGAETIDEAVELGKKMFKADDRISLVEITSKKKDLLFGTITQNQDKTFNVKIDETGNLQTKRLNVDKQMNTRGVTKTNNMEKGNKVSGVTVAGNEIYRGQKYQILHKVPDGYFAMGTDRSTAKIFNDNVTFFDKYDQVQQHAEMEIDGWLGIDEMKTGGKMEYNPAEEGIRAARLDAYKFTEKERNEIIKRLHGGLGSLVLNKIGIPKDASYNSLTNQQRMDILKYSYNTGGQIKYNEGTQLRELSADYWEEYSETDSKSTTDKDKVSNIVQAAIDEWNESSDEQLVGQSQAVNRAAHNFFEEKGYINVGVVLAMITQLWYAETQENEPKSCLCKETLKAKHIDSETIITDISTGISSKVKRTTSEGLYLKPISSIIPTEEFFLSYEDLRAKFESGEVTISGYENIEADKQVLYLVTKAMSKEEGERMTKGGKSSKLFKVYLTDDSNDDEPYYFVVKAKSEKLAIEDAKDYYSEYSGVPKNEIKFVSIEDKRMAKGGSIPNNYKGKTPAQIWDNWSINQKYHFLYDHKIIKLDEQSMIPNQEYSNLPEYIKQELKGHIMMGQYKEGGEVTGYRKGGPLCPKNLEVQSLIFSKDYFGWLDAVRWAESHGYKVENIDEKKNSYRIRQERPSVFRKNSLVSKKFGEDTGITAVLGCLKRK